MAHSSSNCPICNNVGDLIGQTIATPNVGCHEILRCSKCDHQWIPKVALELLEFATIDVEFRNTIGHGKWVLSQLPKALIEKPLLRVLDVGCWDGALLDSLPKTWRRHGVEINKKAAFIAEQRGIKVTTEPIESASLEVESYDLILILDVLEHLEKPIIVFDKISKLLRQNGYLFAFTGNSMSVGARLYGGGWYYYNYPEHLSFFSPSSMQVALNKVGMSVVNISTEAHYNSRFLLALKNIFSRLSGQKMVNNVGLPNPTLLRDKLRLALSRSLKWRDHLVVVAKKEK